MNDVLSFILAVLVYPGLLVALVAAWALGWVRGSARGALSGADVPNPIRGLGEARVTFERETITPDGAQPWLATVVSSAAVLCPLLAIVLLPVPGNPLAISLGLVGDLAVEGTLLLGLPLARIFVGWATPSPYTRLASDRGARLLAGVALPMALALAAGAEQFGSMTITRAGATPTPTTLLVVAYVLAALAFVSILPALARVTPLRQHEGAFEQVAGELGELSGRDLVYFRLGESLQLVAVAVFFVAIFIQPLFIPAHIAAGTGRNIIWIVAILLTAVGIGTAEGIRGHSLARSDSSSVLAWWSGLPLLLSLAALVATAWALRGV